MQSHMRHNIANVFTNRTTWFSRTSATRTDISIFGGKFFAQLRVVNKQTYLNPSPMVSIFRSFDLSVVIMGDSLLFRY